MAHHEMIDGVMKELMRGIKIAAEPINHHNGVHNDMGAISNNGRRARVCVWETDGGRGAVGGGDTASQCHEHPKDALWLPEEMQHHFQCAQHNVRTCFEVIR